MPSPILADLLRQQSLIEDFTSGGGEGWVSREYGLKDMTESQALLLQVYAEI